MITATMTAAFLVVDGIFSQNPVQPVADAAVDQPNVTEEAVHGVGQELRDLVHEQLAGADRRADDANGARRMVNHEQRVEPLDSLPPTARSWSCTIAGTRSTRSA